VTVTPTSTPPPSQAFPLVYVAAGVGGAAILAALFLLIRRRKGMPSPI